MEEKEKELIKNSQMVSDQSQTIFDQDHELKDLKCLVEEIQKQLKHKSKNLFYNVPKEPALGESQADY